MSEYLDQAREGWRKGIDENPVQIVIRRKPQAGDGFDGTVSNPFGTETLSTIKVRISHEAAASDGPGPGGISERMNRYIMVDHLSTIVRGDVFDIDGKTWKIGVVDTIRRFKGIVGYRAPILAIENMEVVT